RKVTDMSYMFRSCSRLEKLNLSSFDMSSLMDETWMFRYCDSLNEIQAPINVSRDVYLYEYFKRSDTGELVKYFPKGLHESITLERAEPIEVTKITLDKSEVELLYSGATCQLIASIEPADATDKSVEWTSSAADIAAVDSTGLVTAHKAGEATITAEARGGEYLTATCKVTVVQMATGLEVKFNKNVNADGEYVLAMDDSVAPTITWDNGEPWPEVIYSVSNDTAAIEDGKLVAKKSGAGTLTVTAKNGDVTGPSASVNYRVYTEKVSGIKLNADKVILDAQSRNAFLLEATIDNADVAYADVEFSVDKPESIMFINQGENKAYVVLKDTNPITATVTATATDGSGKSATCTIVSGTCVNSITVSAPLETGADGAYLLGEGKSAKLTAGILPANATVKTVTWTSSDATVAKVDANGTVTAVKPGLAFIYATATDGSEVNGTAVINVTRPASAVKLELVDNESGKVGLYYPEAGSEFEVKAVLTGTDGKTDHVAQDVSYTLSGKGAKGVVYLGEGRFVAKEPGVVTVTATAKDGSKVKASMQITIEQRVYAFDVQAPKKTESYVADGVEHWIAYTGAKDVTLTPVVTYNDGVKEYAPAKAYQNIEFDLSSNDKFSLDKKGTGIVVSKNTAPGVYPVIIKNKDLCEMKLFYIDVVKAEENYLKDAAIVLPKNMPILADDSVLLAEGSKVKLSASVNGVENLKGYTVTWSVAGNENNTGSAAISAAGLLDLSKAKASEEYLVTLTVSKGETTVTKMLSVAVSKKTDVSAMKLVLAENQSEVLPSSFNVQYVNNGKVFKVAEQIGAANLYSVTGGKKGVLTLEETENGY
ncbi:MAG: Ig-like domain-containing protein, partial [Lachnospiraceae bacterium]|nr:Ig-like domain-containing protein [Lachnospiraceae bacterium]